MNLAQLYSLQLGAHIDKIYTYEKFFPLPFDDYVVFAPFSKPSKCYSLWEEVWSLVFHHIRSKGLQAVQVGGKDERAFPNFYHTQGATSFNQLEYIISKAKLVVSTDTVAAHIAGAYDIPRVILVSNNYSECVAPFFGDKSKQIILEPDRTKLKPTFSMDEPPIKQIDTIPPEKIAHAICKLLDIKLIYPFRQLWIGPNHPNQMHEMVPNTTVNVQNFGLNNIIVRMDFEHNEEILVKQLQQSNVGIITNKPINLEILRQFKPKITELIYIIDENHVPNFYEEVQKIGLNRLVMITELLEDKLNAIKLYYMNLGLILPITKIKKENIKEIEGVSELFYRSRKFTLSNDKIYPSKAAWKQNLPLDINQINLFPVIDNDEFFSEVGHFALLTKE